MAMINWDDVWNSTSCMLETGWNAMVTYIKHSSACTFTIYDDESSSNQLFKFCGHGASCSSPSSLMEGGDDTGDSLWLKANSINTYPFIQLEGDSWLKLSTKNEIHFYDQAQQAFIFAFDYPTSIIYGSDVSWENSHPSDGRLRLCANSIDDYCYIELQGDGGEGIFFHTTSSIFFYNEDSQMLRVSQSGINTLMSGTDANGADLTIYASHDDSFPLIRMRGNEGIELSVNSGYGVIFQENGSNFMTFEENGTDDVIHGETTNNDLFLDPDGSGVVKFGTYAAKGAEAFAGFVTIKDAAGNSRKVMICA